MATRTARCNARMVHCRTTLKASGRLMTCLTSCSGLNVGGRFRLHICKVTTMTARTTRRDARMVHRSRYKATCAGVTGLTLSCGWNVCR